MKFLVLFLSALLIAIAPSDAVMGADRGRQNDYHKTNTPLYKPQAYRNQGKVPKPVCLFLCLSILLLNYKNIPGCLTRYSLIRSLLHFLSVMPP